MTGLLPWLLPAWAATLAVVAVPLARWRGERAGGPLALGLAAAVVPVAVWFSDGGHAPLTWSRPWIPSLGVEASLRLDALAAVFVLLVLIVGAAVLWFSRRYLAADDRPARYYCLLLAFATAMLVVVLADDLLLLYAGWEGTTLASFLLIAHHRDGRAAAGRALLVTFAGGLALLAAAVLGSVTAGSFSLQVLTSPAAWTDGVRAFLVLLLLAAGTKSAQVPAHTWLPAAMVAPTPVSAYLHAAAMVKAGVYLLLRFSELLATDPAVSAATLVLGAVTAVFGASAALRRHDLKEVLAYSTISQLGFLFVLIGLGTDVAISAAVLHVVAHGLFKSGLFLAGGVVDHELGTRDLRRLGGSLRRLPVTTGAFVLCAASMAGLPPLLGFVSKEEALKGLLDGASVVTVATVGTALVLTVAYSTRIVAAFLRSPRSEGWHRPTPLAAPVAALALAGLAAGLFVARLTAPAHAAAEAGLGVAPSASLGLYKGVTGALVGSVVVIASGGGVWAVSTRLLGRLPPPRAVVDRALDACAAGVALLGQVADRPLSSRAPAWHLGVVAAVWGSALLATVFASGLDVAAPEDSPLRWVLTGLLVLGAVLTATTSDRLAAVAILGVTGFLVAAYYVLHGGADLALTQLVVDALTVSLIVFVFRHLPRSFAPVPWPRRALAAVVALAVGAGAGGAVLLASADAPSATAEHYLTAAPEEGADNVVNAVLTDFRGLDTMVETAVLAVAAIGVVVIFRTRDRRPE